MVVLVPLIVFCAKCIIGASYARVFGTSRLKPVKEPEGERHNFRSGHWRSALREIRELDGLDSESSIYSTVSNITFCSYSYCKEWFYLQCETGGELRTGRVVELLLSFL